MRVEEQGFRPLAGNGLGKESFLRGILFSDFVSVPLRGMG